MLRVSPFFVGGAYLIEPDVHWDGRGFFMESYHKEKLGLYGVEYAFAQDNHSLSIAAGTLRGLHYQQAPMAQVKLVRVLTGAIFDVIVDVRLESQTFGRWKGIVLSAENKRQLLVPAGFAHGFCTLVENTEVLYKVDRYYSPDHDRGIAWNDPGIGIDWPTSTPIISTKDANLPLLDSVKDECDS